jgi:hypothetical protein
MWYTLIMTNKDARTVKEFRCSPVVTSQFRDQLNHKGWRTETTRVETVKFLGLFSRQVAITTASRPNR